MQTKYYIYSYDDSGNRERREIDLTKSAIIRNGGNDSEKKVMIEEIAENVTLKVYPNPTKGLLKISISGLGENNATVTVYSNIGSLIYSGQIDSTLTEIDLHNQPAGIYILRVLAGQDFREWKIIKD